MDGQCVPGSPDRSVSGRKAFTLPESDVPAQELPDSALLRDDVELPEVLARVDVVVNGAQIGTHLVSMFDTTDRARERGRSLRTFQSRPRRSAGLND